MPQTIRRFAPILLACCAEAAEPAQPAPVDRVSSTEAPVPKREETSLPVEDGHVFALRMKSAGSAKGVVILTHGAGSPGSATWDLEGASMMRALADAGFDAYAFDARGFGGSSKPPQMSGPQEGEPVVRAQDVMADIDAVWRWAGSPAEFDLLGWSWGCAVAGTYAAAHPERVRRLVLFAPVWARQRPSRHITNRVWREESRSLHARLRDAKRDDPETHAAFVEALFRFTPEGAPLRLPNGPYRDLYGPDGPVWDPSEFPGAALIVRGSLDRAATRTQGLALYEAFAAARRRRYVELADVGHFAFRRKGHEALEFVVLGFLSEPIAGE